MVNVAAAADAKADDDDFFARPHSSYAPRTPSDELQQYLQMPSSSSETSSIAAWPALKALFIRLNTPLPASTAAEQLFSCAGLTMSSHHTSLSDELFENLVLLKKNINLFK